ncbi:MAG: GNAT family N-acetyltransferase [Faecousia sp.]
MIRQISSRELNSPLFSDFHRHQQVTKCWRKVDEEWIIIDNPFTEDWGEQEYRSLAASLQNTIATGGVVYGAFLDGKLKGFVSVENTFFGSRKQYLELSGIHVSEDCRGCGIGHKLVEAAIGWAKKQGAQKLYISAHSAVESQAFYRAMGCREAEEYNQASVEKEPFDCQLELLL